MKVVIKGPSTMEHLLGAIAILNLEVIVHTLVSFISIFLASAID